MEHGVGQGIALCFLTCREQESAHALLQKPTAIVATGNLSFPAFSLSIRHCYITFEDGAERGCAVS
ncbi:MAG: hypothetical protein QM664_14245 [Flavihumibacter sp.]